MSAAKRATKRGPAKPPAPAPQRGPTRRYDALPELRGQGDSWHRLLRAASEQRLHHAVLLSGPRGCGKSLAARWLAHVLLCGELSGESPAAQRVARASHPDLHIVTLPEDRQDVPISSVRALQDELERSAVEGGARVAIVDPADRLNEQGQNALLKTLEEPGPATWLILVTSRPEALLDTIRSRAYAERVLPLSDAEVAAELGLTDPERPTTAALLREAGGSLGQAQAALGEERRATVERLAQFLADSSEDAAVAARELLDGADDKRAVEDRFAALTGALAQRVRAGLSEAVGSAPAASTEAGPGPAAMPAYGNEALDVTLAAGELVLAAIDDVRLGLAPAQVLESLLLQLRHR